MNYTFDLDTILQNYRTYVDTKFTKLQDIVDATKQRVLKSTPETIESLLKDYDEARDDYSYFHNKHNSWFWKWYEDVDEHCKGIKGGYATFDKMACGLTRNLGSVEVKDDKIIIPAYGDLSFVANSLSKTYGFHCGMFTFDSSFTTHEAYTDDGDWRFHIGYLQGDHSKLIIEFDLKQYADGPEAFNRW